MPHRMRLFAFGLALAAAGPLHAQWFELEDPDTGVVCGLVNAENVTMVIADPASTLILVNGADRELLNTLVQDDPDRAATIVTIDGEEVGYIEFATDAEGHRRVFWVTEIGSLYRLSTEGDPIATEVFPEDVVGDCDPCLYWDDEADCTVGEVVVEDDVADSLGTALVQGLCGLGSGTALIGTLALGMVALRPGPGRRHRWL